MIVVVEAASITYNIALPSILSLQFPFLSIPSKFQPDQQISQVLSLHQALSASVIEASCRSAY